MARVAQDVRRAIAHAKRCRDAVSYEIMPATQKPPLSRIRVAAALTLNWYLYCAVICCRWMYMEITRLFGNAAVLVSVIRSYVPGIDYV